MEAVNLQLHVGDVEKQNGSTGDMIYSIADLVSSASNYVTLEPGDIILTGSPAGVGEPSKDFLQIEDVLSA